MTALQFKLATKVAKDLDTRLPWELVRRLFLQPMEENLCAGID